MSKVTNNKKSDRIENWCRVKDSKQRFSRWIEMTRNRKFGVSWCSSLISVQFVRKKQDVVAHLTWNSVLCCLWKYSSVSINGL